MKYAALLRGINVGGRIIKMADLKVCFEDLGFGKVGILLQSGNVVFESSEQDTGKLKREIEANLSQTFGYSAKVQIFDIEILRKIIASYPFGVANASQHDYVIFMENGLEHELVAEPCEFALGEKIKVGSGVVYWRVDKGSTLKSNFAKLLVKAKYKHFNTNRNLRTLQKLAA